MRMIIKDRGSGKTTELIYTSEATGFRILTVTDKAAKYIINLAEELHCVIPKPVPYAQYIKAKGMYHDKGILLDEVKYMLDNILDDFFGVHVYAGTMSNDLLDYAAQRKPPITHDEYMKMIDSILKEKK